MHQLILASQSPRRSELLRSAGFDFKVDTVKVSETIDENLNLTAAIEAVAREKAKALIQLRKYPKGQGILVLAADTVVVLADRVLGKPKDNPEAAEILRLLSGREHRVITGLCVFEIDTGKIWTCSDTTYIQFRQLTDDEIQDYVMSGEPMDKAGAYGIQGRAGKFVDQIRGSFSNVVGLPMELLERIIGEHGWNIPRSTRPPVT